MSAQAETIVKHLDDATAVRLADFGDGYTRCLILGTMRKRALGTVPVKLVNALQAEIENDEVLREIAPFQVPGHIEKPSPLVSLVVDAREAQELVRSGGWSTVQKFTNWIWRKSAPLVHNARPLNPAHMAVAVAAGFLTNVLLDCRPEGGPLLLIKGATTKREQELESTEIES